MTTLPNSSVGLGGHPALLVIDATLGFTDPASPLGLDGSAALRNVALLLDNFRGRGAPVVYTVNAYASPDEARVFRMKLPVLDELAANGRWAAIDPRVAPRAGETILRKTVPSAFFDSPLRRLLRGHCDRRASMAEYFDLRDQFGLHALNRSSNATHIARFGNIIGRST
jgi:nicotinamidase-related amidase